MERAEKKIMGRERVAILIIAYKEPHRFQRLLESVSRACYNEDRVDLIISIDKSDRMDVVQLAEAFVWKYGNKIIRTFSERQGLRRHILSCGDYLDEYDALFILEDDLIVSPQFYRYGIECIKRYRDEERVAGISLYSPQWNQNANFPFVAQKGRYDVYFLQCAQSWGQIWLRKQWKEFKNWYRENDDFFEKGEKENIPHHFYTWGENSWLKYHAAYCIECGKYFVCPYYSYTSTFMEVGEHTEKQITRYHSCLMVEEQDEWCFPETLEEGIIYDAFFENRTITERLARYWGKAVCLDLYGMKKDYDGSSLLLSTRQLPYKILEEYGLQLRPPELNPLFRIEGKGIFLYDLNCGTGEPKKKNGEQVGRIWNYHMRDRFLMANEILPVAGEKFLNLLKILSRSK